jgi:hypothetical protein
MHILQIGSLAVYSPENLRSGNLLRVVPEGLTEPILQLQK